MALRATLPMYFLALMTACGGAESDGPDGGSVPGGPIVSALTSSMPSITDGETVIFTATVTDPDGLADITLGRLEDMSGKVHYGDFEPAGGNQFTLTLDWDAMNGALVIDFAEQEFRTFRAEFTDEAGHVGSRDVTLQLSCGGQAACAGACTDSSTSPDNCGTCGHVCPVRDGHGGCQASACLPTLSACVDAPAGMTCDQICAAQAGTCAAAACGAVTAIGYSPGGCESFNSTNSSNDACADPLSNVFLVARCCCTFP